MHRHKAKYSTKIRLKNTWLFVISANVADGQNKSRIKILQHYI